MNGGRQADGSRADVVDPKPLNGMDGGEMGRENGCVKPG